MKINISMKMFKFAKMLKYSRGLDSGYALYKKTMGILEMHKCYIPLDIIIYVK